MRYYKNGPDSFTVSYTATDSAAFSHRWPCSTVRGHGSFSFSRGDLVDVEGSAAANDGNDWRAFSEDCQAYGERKHNTR